MATDRHGHLETKEKARLTKFAITRLTRRKRASIRIVHGKLGVKWAFDNRSCQKLETHPTSGISFRAAMGRTVPPIDEPTATKPIARPRRRLNQCAMTAYAKPISLGRWKFKKHRTPAEEGPNIPPHASYILIQVKGICEDRANQVRTPVTNP